MKDTYGFSRELKDRSRRAVSDGSNSGNGEPPTINRPSARPSSNRPRGPRTENLASKGKVHSSETERESCGVEGSSEIERLRKKITESDLAKTEAQVQLKYREDEVAKLEHYVNQLLNERGEIDKKTMESIIRDLEESALVKRTQKQLADLKDELQCKEQLIASLTVMKANQDSRIVQKVAKDVELTANKNKTLITTFSEHGVGDTHGSVTHSSHNDTGPQVTELEKLRSQNSALMAEITNLRYELEGVCSRDRKDGSEKDMQDGRIRWRRGNGQDGVEPPWIVHRDGETVIRMGVFAPGENVLARNGESRGEWSHAKIIRRNEDDTYCVAFNDSSEERHLHSTMLHPRDGDLQQKPASRDEDDNCGEHAKSVEGLAAEEAELRYAAKRKSLLTAARDALPGIMKVGQEVLARYPGRNVWGPGLVAGLGKDGLHLSINFDSGEFVDNLPFIFVRSRFTGNLLSGKVHVHPGDAVLAQKEGTPSSADWYLTHFKSYQRNGDCSLIFDSEEASTTINAVRVQLLYDTSTKDGPAEIPGFPPPPTKPVRAKKHHDGDIVMACIPKVKAWTPALVTGSKGRGRYTVEWADGEKVESLLFKYMAPLGKQEPESGSDIVTERCSSSQGDQPAGLSDIHHNDGTIDGDETIGEAQNAQPCDRADLNETSKSLRTHVRLRQPQLKVGEPVLAKSQEDSMWSPGSIKNVLGNGKYDVLFTDGSVKEGLSFLFIRKLDIEASGEDGGESAEITDPARGVHKVGDTVYVLNRDQSPQTANLSLRNREVWRAGVISCISGDRFTVVYDGEDGKPQEACIHAERIRQRRRIRQKVAEKGDAVLALSKQSGRGWMMGVIVGRAGKGTYKVAFSDGSEEDDVRFFNLRRVESNANEDDKVNKPAMRAIRQRRFHMDELALTRHPESGKWCAASVLEALPNGRYDLKLIGDGDLTIRGVAFQSMRHLDCAQIPSNSAVLVRGESLDLSQPKVNAVRTDDSTLDRATSVDVRE